jgi:hypothetical protein
MSETSISSISSMRPVEVSMPAPLQSEPVAVQKQGAPALAKIDSHVEAKAMAQVEAAAVSQPGAPSEPKPARVEPKSGLPVGNGSDVSIHFRVDEETKDLTVFVVDRKSKRVLRSIPANELAKLQAGDLLKLTA